MGVASVEIDLVHDKMLKSFTSNSLPYLSTPEFIHKFVIAEVPKLPKKYFNEA